MPSEHVAFLTGHNAILGRKINQHREKKHWWFFKIYRFNRPFGKGRLFWVIEFPLRNPKLKKIT
jgi:hypothetical protein